MTYTNTNPLLNTVPDNYSDNTAARGAIGLQTSQVMRPGWNNGLVNSFNDPSTKIIGGQPNDFTKGFNNPKQLLQPNLPNMGFEPWFGYPGGYNAWKNDPKVNGTPNFSIGQKQVTSPDLSQRPQLPIGGNPLPPNNQYYPQPIQPQPIQPNPIGSKLQPNLVGAPPGTPPPTQPLPVGAIGWLWYNGQWAPNYQRYPASPSAFGGSIGAQIQKY